MGERRMILRGVLHQLPLLAVLVVLWMLLWGSVSLLTLLTGILLAVAWPFVVRPAPVLNEDAAYPGAVATASWSPDQGGVLRVQPRSGTAGTLLVIYPGGLVAPQAYQWLGTALAPHGVETVIVRFPLDLAVTGIGRADRVISQYGQGRPVYLAGHSLGGAMAAQYLNDSRTTGQVQGLILMGAYPPARVQLQARRDLRVLSLWAEHDRVANAAQYQAGFGRLPPGTKQVTVEGAVHAFFGRYGPQAGDGQPTVARAQAEAQIVRAVLEFLTGDMP